MSDTKRVLIIIVSTILIGAVIFFVVWGVINFDAVKKAMSGTALYTQEDLDNAYRDGYDTAFTDKKDYLTQIEDLRKKLDSAKADYSALESDYNAKVSELNASESEKAQLSAELTTKKLEIETLQKQITELQTSIDAYEEIMKQIEAENKVVATYMYDGAVYLVQTYDVGATLTDVPVIEDTEDITFNGWMIDNQSVDLSNYVINQNTTFVADLTYTYTVTFRVDDEVISTQRAIAGESIEIPSNPEKAGYIFMGWSKDGANVVDVVSENVSASADYIAVFELFTIKVKVDGENSADGENALIALFSDYPLKEGDVLWFNGDKALIKDDDDAEYGEYTARVTKGGEWYMQTYHGDSIVDAAFVYVPRTEMHLAIYSVSNQFADIEPYCQVVSERVPLATFQYFLSPNFHYSGYTVSGLAEAVNIIVDTTACTITVELKEDYELTDCDIISIRIDAVPN